jgi:DNA-binding LacI/PurR family transcriptional regulator
MKKALALILALSLCLGLFACGNGDGGTSPTPSTAPATETPPVDPGTPTAPPDLGNDLLDKVGFYDPDYDYSANKKYKFTYMVVGMETPFNQDFHKGFTHWASKANVEYDAQIRVAATNEDYLAQLSQIKEQGYDGLLADPDMTVYAQIAQICSEIGLQWMGGMGSAQAMSIDADGNVSLGKLLHPYVGFSHFEYGIEVANKLLAYAKANWADIPLDEIGLLQLDMAISPPLHQRIEGSTQAWLAAGGSQDNIVYADVPEMTQQAAQAQAQAAISQNSQFEYWLVVAVIDDFAAAAAESLEQLGLGDQACGATVGGTMLMQQWDSGRTTSWKYALSTPTGMYAEPIFFALYAFVNGDATPENIWPSWINHSAESVAFYGDTYAQLMLPSYWMEQDSYKKLFAWADVYMGGVIYGYDQTGITRDDFPGRVSVPDYYKG